MEEAVLLDAFWTAVACNAPPDTQLVLAGTSLIARDAVVQYAQKATLTLQLTPPPTPGTLGLLRTSGRTLPTTIIINNCIEPPNPLNANRITCPLMPQLSCPAVTTLQLGGGTWLVDTALLAGISAALPGLSKLVLKNVITPPHLPAPTLTAPPHLLPAPGTPTPAWPSLRTVRVMLHSDHHAADVTQLLTVLGIRAGGGVISLGLSLANRRAPWQRGSVITPLLTANQMHVLRKLDLPSMQLWEWGADEVGGALIRNAPVLEHLKVHRMGWSDGRGTSAMCAPWRIVEVQELDVPYMAGLPLGSTPGQPPLILRVVSDIKAYGREAEGGTDHLVSPAPGKRRVQLECTRLVYTCLDCWCNLAQVLRVLTLTTTGLSNLIMDGIDSADDIKDLIGLSATGLRFYMGGCVLKVGVLEGLSDLPQVTRVEVTGVRDVWGEVDDGLLAALPSHVTDVRLVGGASLELVARMCVHVSRLPHRQAHPLRMSVEGAEGWFDAAVRTIQAAGISTPGVVEALFV